MAARLYVCYGMCGEKHEKEALVNHNGKNYCQRCLEKKLREQQERQELYNYIKEIYNIDFPTGYMLKSIKQYKEQQGYKLKGMLLTLKYCKEVKRMTFNPKMGLGIISYEYENAKRYWIEHNQKLKNHKDVEIVAEEIIITKLDSRNYYRESKLISWEDVL